ncbi:hydrophobin [Trametes versicolor FP-101664 SS1]|uniref:hydrophobin n=1 Tax=Trametes versicolor (strain FP-101664) TaxID=717944 RepID=UPI00046249AD|nr:hydrophobin [Trametes versicolor FP-101664 SS1]EIW52193.1 hydrophobin [Trametes versicolor FP-101664 SS1]
MFAKLFTLFALAILAVATPAPAADASCSTGALQCCQSVEPAGSEAVAPILAGLGVVVQDLNIPVGVTCTAITVVGVGSGSSCSENTVCCDDNSFGGLVSIGCLPASV